MKPAAKRAKSAIVVSIDPAARTALRSSCGSTLPSAVQPSARLRGEIGPPHHAGVGHAEAVEHAALHLGAEIEAEPALEHELEQDQPFARISVARARIEMEAKPPVRLDEGEIGEARAVREQDARRQPAPALVAGEMVPGRVRLLLGLVIVGQRARQIVGDRAVEVDPPLLGQLHHRVGEHRLGQRRAVHHRVGLERRASGVAMPPGADQRDPPVLDHREREAARAGARHRRGGLRRRSPLGRGRGGARGIAASQATSGSRR